MLRTSEVIWRKIRLRILVNISAHGFENGLGHFDVSIIGW